MLTSKSALSWEVHLWDGWSTGRAWGKHQGGHAHRVSRFVEQPGSPGTQGHRRAETPKSWRLGRPSRSLKPDSASGNETPRGSGSLSVKPFPRAAVWLEKGSRGPFLKLLNVAIARSYETLGLSGVAGDADVNPGGEQRLPAKPILTVSLTNWGNATQWTSSLALCHPKLQKGLGCFSCDKGSHKAVFR